MAPINVPKIDLSIYPVPKCGGTSLWHYCYYLRTGHSYNQNASIYDNEWMLGQRLSKSLIVVRDPIERFVSAYRNSRDIRGLALEFDEFIARFESLYEPPGSIQHHFRPQSECVQRSLSCFDYVVRFSQFDSARKILESLSSVVIPFEHLQKAKIAKPVVTEAQRCFIRKFYAADYKLGFCEIS